MKELYKALFAIQGRAKTLPKPKQGHGYRYTPLDVIVDYIRPLLQEYGVFFFQTIEDVEGRLAVRTVVVHAETEQSIESLAVAPVWRDPIIRDGEGNPLKVTVKGFERFARYDNASSKEPIQELGTDATYLRRYAISAMFGLTTDEDTDGISYAPSEQDEANRALEISSWITSAEEVLSGDVNKQTFTNLRKNAEQKFGSLPKEISKFLKDKFKEMGFSNA